LQSILLWYQAPKCPASSTWTSPFGTSLRNAPARRYRTRDHACPRTKSSGCVLCNQACHFGSGPTLRMILGSAVDRLRIGRKALPGSGSLIEGNHLLHDKGQRVLHGKMAGL